MGPSETALWAAATTFLPFLFGCKLVEFRCKSAPVSDGQSGEAFVGGVRSGSSSSPDSVPPLISCSGGDTSSSSISPSPLLPVNWLSSPVEDRSGRTFCQSERVKRKGQRCHPLRLSTHQRLKDQERALQDLPQTLVSLALGGGSHQKGEYSQSCEKCWDLPCSYEV